MKRYLGLALAGLVVVTGCGERAPTESAEATGAVPLDAPQGVQPPIDPALPKINSALAATLPSSPGRTQCKDVMGFLDDPDPAGRIVRDAPSASGRELGRILPPSSDDDWGGGLAATFEVLGSQNGWLEIEGAGFDEQLYGKNAPKMYTGRGWIAGGGVRIILQSQLGFAKPSHQSPVLIDLTRGGHFDGTPQQGIVACDGRWVLADWRAGPDKSWQERPMPRYRPEAIVSKSPLVLRAWVTGVCNIEETTCDGVDGNRRETSRLEGDH